MKMKTNGNIQITVLGGGREIGANAYLLQWGEVNILLDAGQNPQAELAEALVPLHRIPHQLDAMIISHGHFDHIGSIPFIWHKRHPKKIITQKYSRNIIQKMTYNSAAYMKRFDLESQKYAYSKSYYWKELKKLMEVMKRTTYPYNYEFTVSDGIKGFFFDAGHILGSSGIVLTDGDYIFVYTGDIALNDHGVHLGATLPEMDAVDCLLIESTTSSEKNVVDEKDQWKKFFEKINDASSRQSRILIPAFALGRSQDIVALVDYGKRTGRIPNDIPIYLTGLGNAITDIYETHKNQLRQDIFSGSFKPLFEPLEFSDLIDTYQSFVNQKETAIFIATNGMMAPGTPSAVLGGIMASNPNETIIMSGYQSPGTLGFDILNAKTGSIIDFGEHSIHNVKVTTPYRYQVRMSGHGSINEMVEIANRFKPNNIGVIHGESSSVQNLVNALQVNHSTVLGPDKGETLLLKTSDSRKMRSKSDIKAQIITVGTSLLGTYSKEFGRDNPTQSDLVDFILKGTNCSTQCCAEIQTMEGLDIKHCDYLYFISSGEEDGIMCGEALALAYQQSGYPTQNISITGLTKNYEEFQRKGLPQFIHTLLGIIDNHHKNANILATGGFKAEIAYATMIGSLTKVSVFYIHEDFHHVVELPGLPVGLDLSSWTTYFNTIELVLIQNRLKKAQKIIQTRLPDFMKILFVEDKDLNQMKLTPVGELIKRLHAEHILSQENIVMLTCSEKIKHLWGIGPIKIKSVPGNQLRLILNRFQLQSAFIREMRIGKILAKTSNVSMIKFHHKTNKKVYYHILTPNGGQELIIHTYPGVEKELINRMGKTLKE